METACPAQARGTQGADRQGAGRPRSHQGRAALPPRGHHAMPQLQRRDHRPARRPAAVTIPPAVARCSCMLIAGAVCPHPPLLIPAALGAAASDPPAELRKVAGAARQVVARLIAAGPDLIVVVGGGPVDREYGPAAAGGLHDYGVDVTVGTGDPVLPLSLTVGRWLLEQAGVLAPAGGGGGVTVTGEWAGTGRRVGGETPAVLFQAVAQRASPGNCLKLGMVLAER